MGNNSNKLKNGEIIWQSVLDKNGIQKYMVTSKPDRSMYYLYTVGGNTFKKVEKSKTPLKFKETLYGD